MNEIDNILGLKDDKEVKEVLKPKLDLYNIAEAEDYFKKVKNGTLEQGLGLNSESLDAHFRYKKGNFVIIHGIDNVGKSSLCWWKLAAYNMIHGIKTVFYCTENKERQVIKNMMQYRCGKQFHELNELQLKELKNWFSTNFKIIRINEDYTLDNVLDQIGEVASKYDIDNAMIDPYNALAMPSKVNGHDYHLECVNKIKKHNRTSTLSTWINCHPNTEAYRNIEREKNSLLYGHAKAPTKGHIDGGAKFAAKADEFLTYHRYTEHEQLWKYTQIFVRKTKDTETGGQNTPITRPVTCKMNTNGCGFSFDLMKTPIEAEAINDAVWTDPLIKYYSFGEPKQEQQIIESHNRNDIFKKVDSNFEIPKASETDWSARDSAPF